VPEPSAVLEPSALELGADEDVDGAGALTLPDAEDELEWPWNALAAAADTAAEAAIAPTISQRFARATMRRPRSRAPTVGRDRSMRPTASRAVRTNPLKPRQNKLRRK
jgi:hypothetical protein